MKMDNEEGSNKSMIMDLDQKLPQSGKNIRIQIS